MSFLNIPCLSEKLGTRAMTFNIPPGITDTTIKHDIRNRGGIAATQDVKNSTQ